MKSPAIAIRNLSYTYEGAPRPTLSKMSVEIPRGSRTLLIGANGVGKSTLLSLLAGRHLIPEGAIEVLGYSPFHALGVSQEVGLIDGDYPVHVDLKVQELLSQPADRSPEIKRREKRILELLEISPNWRMCHVSEGQRRRVQILLSLRRPRQVLLLDEVSSHLDVKARAELMNWLKSESIQTGMTIVYATHIFDGLWPSLEEAWPSHLALMSFKKPLVFKSVAQFPEITQPSPGIYSPLYQLALGFISQDR